MRSAEMEVSQAVVCTPAVEHMLHYVKLQTVLALEGFWLPK
jgi:hypothetical protein